LKLEKLSNIALAILVKYHFRSWSDNASFAIHNSATTKGCLPDGRLIVFTVSKELAKAPYTAIAACVIQMSLAISVTTRSPVRVKSTENTITLSATANLNKWLATANFEWAGLPVTTTALPVYLWKSKFPKAGGFAGN